MTAIFTVLYLCLTQGAAHADMMIEKLVPVSEVSIDRTTGCGTVPIGGSCQQEDSTEVTFTVAYGGSCHTYRAVVSQNETLSILDSEMLGCTRPEIQFYRTSVEIKNNFQKEAVNLANQIFVRTQFKP